MNKQVDNWASDKLNRKPSADFLTSYLTKRYALSKSSGKPNSLVLNIRANWGYGKTFFVTAWIKDLKQLDYPVVYFDAWANDFSDDPLVGFISEMNEALADRFKSMPVVKRHVDETFAIGKRLIKPVTMAVASVLAKKLAGHSLDELKDFFTETAKDASGLDMSIPDQESDAGDDNEKDDSISTVIGQCAEAAVKEHASKKETIAIFRQRLERLIVELSKKSSVQLPMFVFIDELDRCRPNYAIELLEAIKHLFGVPGIYFVTSTNLDQLGHSVRVIYGENFDSEQYLKRFFDQEYLLPEPDFSKYASFLWEQYDINKLGDFFTGVSANIHKPNSIIGIYIELVRAFNFGLRDQEQVISSLYAVLLNWPREEKVHLIFLLCLVMTKQKNTSAFQALSQIEHPNKDRFKEVIKSCLNFDAGLQIRARTQSNTGGIKVFDAFFDYFRLSGTSTHAMSDDTSRFDPTIFIHPIQQQILKDEYYDRHNPRDIPLLSEYHSRVSQAGQLSSQLKINH